MSRAAATGVTPRKATLLYEDRSAPLARILASMNQRSDDFFAEMLTKGWGAAFEGTGSPAAGVRVERAYARTWGVGHTGMVVADGSGLSYADLETSIVMSDCSSLRRAAPSGRSTTAHSPSPAKAARYGRASTHGRPGQPARQDGHPRRGKQPLGYVTAANGHLLAFAILMNGDPFDLGVAQQSRTKSAWLWLARALTRTAEGRHVAGRASAESFVVGRRSAARVRVGSFGAGQAVETCPVLPTELAVKGLASA